MPTFVNRKNKIILSDYNYRQDIENRLFMAELTILEVDVLKEIINGSLKTTITALADNLNVSSKNLKVILEKLSKSRLFKIQDDTVLVDKEMRRYYEAQIIKFEDDFNPDLEYVQGLLNKVSIHSLPLWYAIPRSSNNIFQSIVEKFLITPKAYERYLQELTFENPLHTAIVQEIFSAPSYKISSTQLIEKFELTREQFEEHMLFLEFSLVCCISYNKTKDIWEEVVTPFHEWREYQLFIINSNPPVIKDSKNIKGAYQKEFGFLLELNAFLKSLLKKPISSKDAPNKLLETALVLKIAKVDKQKITTSSHTEEWLKKTLNEQAIVLYRQALQNLLEDDSTYSEKDFREVEKSLKRIAHGNWVYFDEFMKGCLAAVGSAQPVHLQNKGKRWKYSIPKYNEEEINFIKLISCDYFMQTGMVDVGQHQDKLCLRLTPFGRHSLG